VKFPEHLAKRLKIYLWLRKHGLGLDEIKFLIAESFE
jgi:DNA-binding transcriptional MerR regulator